jgi:hypothetical protein
MRCRPRRLIYTAFTDKWSVGSPDLPHFISTVNGDLKLLTPPSLMKGDHCDCFALNNILWLKQLRTGNDANDQNYSQ